MAVDISRFIEILKEEMAQYKIPVPVGPIQ